MENTTEVELNRVECSKSSSTECFVAYWIWRTVPFLLLTIGTCGNLLSCIVLVQPALRNFSTTVYLLFLSASDIFFLWFSLLPDTNYSITGNRFADHSKIFCKIRSWLGHTAGSFSVWLLVLLTVERFLLIKSPIHMKVQLTPKVSFIASSIALCFFAVFNAHCIYGFAFYDNSEDIIKTLGQQMTAKHCTFINKGYKIFYERTWTFTAFIVFNIVPGVIIVIGNVSIAYEVASVRNRVSPQLDVRLPAVTPKKVTAVKHGCSTSNQNKNLSPRETDVQPIEQYIVLRASNEHMGNSHALSWANDDNKLHDTIEEVLVLGQTNTNDKEEAFEPQLTTEAKPEEQIHSNDKQRDLKLLDVNNERTSGPVTCIQQEAYENNKSTFRHVSVLPTASISTTAGQRTLKRSPTRTLFTLTTFYIITTLPFCIFHIINVGKDKSFNDDLYKWQLSSVVVLCLGWCNFTFNFFLYFVSGTLFKKEFSRLRNRIYSRVIDWFSCAT